MSDKCSHIALTESQSFFYEDNGILPVAGNKYFLLYETVLPGIISGNNNKRKNNKYFQQLNNE